MLILKNSFRDHLVTIFTYLESVGLRFLGLPDIPHNIDRLGYYKSLLVILYIQNTQLTG